MEKESINDNNNNKNTNTDNKTYNEKIKDKSLIGIGVAMLIFAITFAGIIGSRNMKYNDIQNTTSVNINETKPIEIVRSFNSKEF